jgi:DNA-binding transcriptional LysR family regulator
MEMDLDAFTLDQLRTMRLVAREGSFSAAARRLQRVQSAVSQAMANLEAALGVTLWDRGARVPALTPAGAAVLAAAERVCAEADALRGLAASLRGGTEATVSVCVDALFPLPVLAEVCGAFAGAFPTVDLRVDTQALSAVSARVLDGSATLGVVSPMGVLPGLVRRRLATVRMVPVASPKHPLARPRGAVPLARFADAVQVVLAERGGADVSDQAVLSRRTWRVADLHTKHALLRAGLGWGNVPEHLAREDLRRKRLVVVRPETWHEDEHLLHLYAVHRADAALGPAHRWLIERLAARCAEAVAPPRRARGSRPRKTP